LKEERRPRLAGIIIPLVLAFCTACSDPDDTGIDILPPEDLIGANFVDTFSIEGRTFRIDSVFSFNPNFNLIGEYYDEEFGRINAATFTQFHTSGDAIVFGSAPSNLTLDSVVLNLDIEGFYGRLEDRQELEVFEVTGEFPDTAAFTNQVLATDSYELASGKAIALAAPGGRITTNDLLSIRLDDSLGRKLLFAPTSALINNSTFRDYFKGLRIGVKPVGFGSREPGAIFGFDLLSNRTGLTLYYHDTTTAKLYTFDVDDDTPRFHTINRTDFTSKLLGQMEADSLNPMPANFMVQAGAFVKMFIKIPYLENLRQVGVNRADLILKVDESLTGSEERYDPPAKLFLYYADSTGRNQTGISVSNGVYDPVTATYSIPLTSNIMAIINGQRENNGFILIPGNTNITLNRAVIGGPLHPTLAPRLKVIFTSLPG
jgi:Domain of unknown function (DUF4270)